jgi:glyoxalase family protein
MYLTGLHHITAVTANITDNLHFYTEVLGLRLVKKSVNQDDVSAYHLFYADKSGTPGTDLTFFDWPTIGNNLPGTDSIAGTAFRVSSRDALDFWVKRFEELNVKQTGRHLFADQEILPFRDPEGQQLYLVNDQGADFEGQLWPHPEIPEDYLIRGLHSVILSVAEAAPLAELLSRTLYFEEKTRAEWIDGQSPAIVFTTSPNGAPGTELWLLEQPDLPPARLGAGGVHHVAFRVDDFDSQQEWHGYLTQLGFPVSPLIDRFWFRSIYFRISPGILFEIATDGPGFAIDEDPEKLGQELILPPFLEDQREQIEAGLTPIPG